MRLAITVPFGLLLVGALAAGARADLTPPAHVDLSTQAKIDSSRLSTEAAEALIRGDHAAALAAAEKGIAANPDDPWPYYDRGAALVASQRADDAVASFQQAESRFGTGDPWGKSLAIFGRARALSQAQRCEAASAAFEEYASFVADADPGSATMAREYAGQCRPPNAKPVAHTRGTTTHQ